MQRWLMGLVVLAAAVTSYAQLAIPSADGSDGVFSPTDNITVDLSQAPTGVWNGPNAQPGHGVYDPEKWAVVFRYSEVNIPAGKTVSFKNHPSYAPVVWIVSGNVTINGTLDLSSSSYHSNGTLGEPGPGGFRGGSFSTPGFGMGGGVYPAVSNTWYGGSFATIGGSQAADTTYGNSMILPLIGGSGGSSQYSYKANYDSPWRYYDATGGGGAILIVCQSTMTFTGTINACAGSGYSGNYGVGSGGAVRIIANSFSGASGSNGTIRAFGYPYGNSRGLGRIRLEANTIVDLWNCDPAPSIQCPLTSVAIWPEDNSMPVPSIAITKVGAFGIPADPRPGFSSGQQSATLANAGPVPILLEAKNVPDNWTVYVRVVPRSGQDVKVPATKISGDINSSVWQAQATLPNGFTAMQARAVKPAQ